MTTENQAAQESDQQDNDIQKAPPIPFTVTGKPLPDHLLPKVVNALQYANSFILEKDEVPLFGVAVHPNGDTLLGDINDIPSLLQGMALGNFIDKVQATAVIIISEGYQLPEELVEDQFNGKTGYASVKDHPAHFECLRISVEIEDQHWLGSIPFTSKWVEGEGHQLEDKPIELFAAVEAGGPLCNLLPGNRNKQIPEELRSLIGALRDDFGCGTCPACLRRKEEKAAAEKEAANAAADAAGEVVPPDTPVH